MITKKQLDSWSNYKIKKTPKINYYNTPLQRRQKGDLTINIITNLTK